MAGVL